ncbi:MAG: hypothetical protein JWM44_4364 [Bacilli bacterium]|nr:hypothetical protein [Bacilli bacterium]
MYNRSLESSRKHIELANDYAGLRVIRDQVHVMMQEHPLLASSYEWNEQTNDIHDWFIQRCVELAENILREKGFGSPPVPYVFVLFGSGGRREQTLWSDQDNGLIYGLNAEANMEEVSFYFATLAESIVEGLKILGYPPCEGDVICSNALWCKSLEDWKLMLFNWLSEPNWEHIRYLLIVADMRGIYGKSAILAELKSFFLGYVQDHRSILEDMLRNTLHRKTSLGIFGQLLKERYGEDAGGVDIKYGSYIPIVNGIRLLAIQAGISETSTLVRIDQLLAIGFIANVQATEWKRAFLLNMDLRSKTPYQLTEGFYSSRGKLSVHLLTKQTRQELKFSLHAGIDLQKFVQKKVKEEIERLQ